MIRPSSLKQFWLFALGIGISTGLGMGQASATFQTVRMTSSVQALAQRQLLTPYPPPKRIELRLTPFLPHRLLAQSSYLNLITTSLYRHYDLRYPAPPLTAGLGSRQTSQIQIQFVRLLKEDMGPVVGFKAALTNPVAQARFRVTQPLMGFLLEDMLLENGATLTADFGSRPISEGDLMVRVGNDSINTAETNQELLASLDAVIPFIELPDLVYQESAPLDAGALVAANVGARHGVMGTPILITPSEDWETHLGQIQVTLKNELGQTLAVGDSSALLGHPLNVVRWLRDTLKLQGADLKPGDLLSLGTITPPSPVEPGTTIQAHYNFGSDLIEPTTVTVTFEPRE